MIRSISTAPPVRDRLPPTPSRFLVVALALLGMVAVPTPPPTLAQAAVGSEAVAASEASPGLAAAHAYRQENAARMVRDYARFLEIPNVASDREHIRRNAEYLASEFTERGAAMEILELPGQPDVPPVVFGTLPANEILEDGAPAPPTLILYVHYDGQPVDAERWTHDPWTPTLYTGSMEKDGWPRPLPEPGEAVDPDWRLYARAAGDDKAPIASLLGALDALEAAGVPRTVDVKLFFEGEEEAGSPHLRDYLRRYAERLDGDLWLFLDGPVHQSGQPQLFFGVRGIATLEITVYGATRYLHSGHYGNWAPNPNVLLAHLLASMKDPGGEVTVQGFYDTVEPLSAAERAAVEAAPRFEDQLRREMGLAESEGGNETRYLDRILLPSLNVRGLAGATVGDTARNVIPPFATAALDLRLVPGNDPEAMSELVERHVQAQGYQLVRETPDMETRLAHPRIARVVRGGGYPAVRTALDLPLARGVRRAAEAAAPTLEASDTTLVLLPTLGGSLPLYLFEEILATPLLGVPFANHDDNQHAPDENIRLANLWYGMDLLAELLSQDPEAFRAAGDRR